MCVCVGGGGGGCIEYYKWSFHTGIKTGRLPKRSLLRWNLRYIRIYVHLSMALLYVCTCSVFQGFLLKHIFQDAHLSKSETADILKVITLPCVPNHHAHNTNLGSMQKESRTKCTAIYCRCTVLILTVGNGTFWSVS